MANKQANASTRFLIWVVFISALIPADVSSDAFVIVDPPAYVQIENQTIYILDQEIIK